jgi:hypothetical protein
MRRLMQSLLLAAVILVAGCLVTSGAQSARGAVTASSPSAGAPATPPPPALSNSDRSQPDAGTKHRQPDNRAGYGLVPAQPDAEQLVHLNQRV